MTVRGSTPDRKPCRDGLLAVEPLAHVLGKAFGWALGEVTLLESDVLFLALEALPAQPLLCVIDRQASQATKQRDPVDDITTLSMTGSYTQLLFPSIVVVDAARMDP